jgi:hypothetical protein
MSSDEDNDPGYVDDYDEDKDEGWQEYARNLEARQAFYQQSHIGKPVFFEISGKMIILSDTAIGRLASDAKLCKVVKNETKYQFDNKKQAWIIDDVPYEHFKCLKVLVMMGGLQYKATEDAAVFLEEWGVPLRYNHGTPVIRNPNPTPPFRLLDT